MATIVIDGKRYKSIEALPPVGVGMPARVVETTDGEKIAVRDGKTWRFWTANDRVLPWVSQNHQKKP